MHFTISVFSFIAIALINSPMCAGYIIRFKLRAVHLPNSDPFDGQADGVCEVTVRDGQVARYIGQTEEFTNSRDPIWQKEFQVPYSEYQDKELLFMVYDKDVIGEDFVGRAFVYMGHMLDVWKTGPNQGGYWRQIDLTLTPENGAHLWVDFRVTDGRRSAGNLNRAALHYCILVVLVLSIFFSLRI